MKPIIIIDDTQADLSRPVAVLEGPVQIRPTWLRLAYDDKGEDARLEFFDSHTPAFPTPALRKRF